jgi:hypothetical protein
MTKTKPGGKVESGPEVCDGLGGYCKTAFHFDPDAVRDAA